MMVTGYSYSPPVPSLQSTLTSPPTYYKEGIKRKRKNVDIWHDFPGSDCSQLSWIAPHCMLSHNDENMLRWSNEPPACWRHFSSVKKRVSCRTELYCSISTLREDFQIRHQTQTPASNKIPWYEILKMWPHLHWQEFPFWVFPSLSSPVCSCSRFLFPPDLCW